MRHLITIVVDEDKEEAAINMTDHTPKEKAIDMLNGALGDLILQAARKKRT